jgi:hypothetical protein
MVQVSDEIDTSPVRIVAKYAGPRADPGKKRAISWFDPETYSRLVDVLNSPFDFPPSYEQWKKLSEATERYWISRGFHVIRVSVEPKGFLIWCSKRFVKPNSKALEVCINEKVFAGRPSLDEDCP